MIFFVVFFFGLAVGSFLNAFIYRLEVRQKLRPIPHDRRKTGVTVMRGRSFCPSCSHTLAWYDLIPLASFALLQGKCRYCRKPISIQYPLVELATALLFVGVFYLIIPWLGQGVENLTPLSFLQVLNVAYLWAIVSFLVVIFVYDFKHFLIPDKILYPAIGLVLLWRLLLHFQIAENLTSLSFLEALLAGLGAAGFFWAIYLLSKRRAMGFGDVKLALFMGLFLSWPNIFVAMSLAFAAGTIVGLALIFFKRKTMRSEVPFGPFLVFGTLIAFFWGETLVDWYFTLLGV
ncbi:prepilin peptidase [Patescibacteria group bacterium]|nr:prepilin peptidase [Patescibacteria group bacterium]